ncbi:HXXEE domain-containing protein [Falsibacillus pallidus]|uniref:HXXEE domain-containing protein n=1 Tax=Falsibacillus pallidus TaxID=493781 RepID=UPI003D9A039F
MEKWVERNRKDLYEKLPKKAISYFERNFAKKTNQFSLVVYVEFVVISFSTILLYLEGFQGWYKWLYLGLMSVFVLHSLTHIGQAVLLKRYTPGVITSVILIIPYGVVFYRTLLEAGTIDIADIWISIPVGIVVFMLLFPAAMKAASRY